MLFSRRPALRHFAVIEIKQRTLTGSIWSVQDRRNPLRQQFLLVPSRFRSWPMMLARLESLNAAPTRLRSGKVAILFDTENVEAIRTAIRCHREKRVETLNVLSGFESGKQRRKLWLVIVPMMVICGLLLYPAQAEPLPVRQKVDAFVTSQKPDTCSKEVAKGSTIIGSIKRFNDVAIAGEDFRVASYSKLGGFARLTVKRLCDSSLHRLDVWLEGKEIIVERVY